MEEAWITKSPTRFWRWGLDDKLLQRMLDRIVKRSDGLIQSENIQVR
jgi:hypothetical protein